MPPKLPQRAKDILRRFEQLGFIRDHTTGSHVILYHAIRKKRITIPMHRGDLPKGTVRSILREAGMTLEEFLDDEFS